MVNFKKHPEIKFYKEDALNIKKAISLMNKDFKGLNYNPNFDYNFENLSVYIKDFTNTNPNNFNNLQIECIKSVFCL